MCLAEIDEEKLFQFLVGRLKTKAPDFNIKETRKFQFLVGRLKTIENVKERIEKGKFQFLVGRLKTEGCHTGPNPSGSVSIPRR